MASSLSPLSACVILRILLTIRVGLAKMSLLLAVPRRRDGEEQASLSRPAPADSVVPTLAQPQLRPLLPALNRLHCRTAARV